MPRPAPAPSPPPPALTLALALALTLALVLALALGTWSSRGNRSRHCLSTPSSSRVLASIITLCGPAPPAASPAAPPAGRSIEVRNTVRGPRACSASHAATASASLRMGRCVSCSASNWLGVSTDASGSTSSR